MTLAEIVRTFPDLFYRPEPAWYWGHSFMDAQPAEDFSAEFEGSTVDGFERPIVRAVDLARLYVRDPDDPKWQKFYWTDDVDRWGERVYVGGVGLYGIDLFQIHRALTPPCYYVRPL